MVCRATTQQIGAEFRHRNAGVSGQWPRDTSTTMALFQTGANWARSLVSTLVPRIMNGTGSRTRTVSFGRGEYLFLLVSPSV